MKNYEAVNQWAATLSADKAYAEITALKAKYPWLKLDASIALITRMYTDLPKIANIIKMQEKQNAMHREFVRVTKAADESVVTALIEQYKIKL